MEMPPIRYARSGEVNIAYQITGEVQRGKRIDIKVYSAKDSCLFVCFYLRTGEPMSL